MGTYSKFFFRPAKGEHIHTTVEPQVEEECATICGTVTDRGGRPRQGALALLFRTVEGAPPVLLDRAVTDEDGQFFFGPLAGDTLYLVKIIHSAIKVRELEIRMD